MKEKINSRETQKIEYYTNCNLCDKEFKTSTKLKLQSQLEAHYYHKHKLYYSNYLKQKESEK